MRGRIGTIAVAAVLGGAALVAFGAADEPFPARWAGEWKGDLRITAAGRPAAVVPMSLAVGTVEAGRAPFVIRYGEQPARNYELVVVDASEGRYAIDEGNSIVIPARMIGDELVAEFAVGGNRIRSRYRLTGEEMDFELVMSTAAATGRTGGEAGVPEVEIFEPRVIQRARLTR